MEKQKDPKVKTSARMENDEHTLLTVESLPDIEKQDFPETNLQNKPTPYQKDKWEALPFKGKVGILAIATFILVVIALIPGIIERKTEFIIGSILTMTLSLIALGQYYIYKRQAHAMLQGLEKTDSLIAQNNRLIETISDQAGYMKGQLAAANRQAKVAEDALANADKILEFNQTSFYRAERAYLTIRNVRPTVFRPGEPHIELIPHKDPKFAFEIVNGGRTPAFGVYAKVHTVVGELFPAFGEWKEASEEFSTDVIIPSETVKFTSAGNSQPKNSFNDEWHPETQQYWINITLGHWDIGERVDALEFSYRFRYRPETGGILVLSDVTTESKPRK